MFAVLRYPRARLIVGLLAVVLSSLAGYYALIMGSPTEVTVGPFRVEFSVMAASHGKSVVELPPAGALEADTHSAPLQVNYELKEIAISDVEELTDPQSSGRQALENWREPVEREARSMVIRVLMLAAAMGGALGVIMMRRWHWLLICAGVAMSSSAIVGSVAYGTYDTQSFNEPRYSGSLSYAPEILAFSEQTLANLDSYESRVPEIAESLYRTVSELHQLPAVLPVEDSLRVLHISDMHSSAAAARLTRTAAALYGVDLVINSGDETDLGMPLEAGYPRTYLPLPAPLLWIGGNHDTPTITNAMKRIDNVAVLEDRFLTVKGITVGGFPDPAAASLSPRPSDDSVLSNNGANVLAAVQNQIPKPFIAVVHDPQQADLLPGKVPVVVHGHTHHESIEVRNGTVFLDAGSTGAGGFRGFERGLESPSTLHILYISKEPLKLTAVDTITIYGYRQEFSVTRRTFGPDEGKMNGDPDENRPSRTAFEKPPSPLAYFFLHLSR